MEQTNFVHKTIITIAVIFMFIFIGFFLFIFNVASDYYFKFNDYYAFTRNNGNEQHIYSLAHIGNDVFDFPNYISHIGGQSDVIYGAYRSTSGSEKWLILNVKTHYYKKDLSISELKEELAFYGVNTFKPELPREWKKNYSYPEEKSQKRTDKQLEKLYGKIKKGMSVEQVCQILGPPSGRIIYLKQYEYLNKDKKSVVHFSNDDRVVSWDRFASQKNDLYIGMRIKQLVDYLGMPNQKTPYTEKLLYLAKHRTLDITIIGSIVADSGISTSY